MAAARRSSRRGAARGLAPTTSLWKAADRASFDGPLILDTHVWIWLLSDSLDRVSVAARRLIHAANAATHLFVCDISFWEVGTKASKGQLVLSLDPAVWLERAALALGIRYLPLDRAVLVQSTRLAGNPHGDPADRMLIAAAQIHGMPLVTVDSSIISYAAAQPGVPVCDAR